MLAARGQSLDGRRVVVSGSGNVAIYAIDKAQQLVARVVACSDSTGYVVDEKGLDVEVLRQVKEQDRRCLDAYLVGEGANMPTTPDAVQLFLEAGVAFGPGKAANAGDVAASALEMHQRRRLHPRGRRHARPRHGVGELTPTWLTPVRG